MNFLNHVLPRNNRDINEVYRALIFSKKGLIAANRELAVLYKPDILGNVLIELIDKHGAFAVLDGAEFLSMVSTLRGKIKSISLNKEMDNMLIKFGNKGRVSFDIAEVNDKHPHLSLEWYPFPDEKENPEECVFFNVDVNWRDYHTFVSNEAKVIWKDKAGIYMNKCHFNSFDADTYLVSKDKMIDSDMDLFIPLDFYKLLNNDTSKLIVSKDNLHWMHDNFQLATRRPGKESEIKPDFIEEIRTKFKDGKKYDVTFETVRPDTWKRALNDRNLFLSFIIDKNEIFISSGSWKEMIGKTSCPNLKATARINLLKNWITSCSKPSLSVIEDIPYLYGISLKQTEFYGRLHEHQKEVEISAENKEELLKINKKLFEDDADETNADDDADISNEGSLLGEVAGDDDNDEE